MAKKRTVKKRRNNTVIGLGLKKMSFSRAKGGKKKRLFGSGGLTKKGGKSRKKNARRGTTTSKIKVNSKQLAGLAPMNQLELYRSQLATGHPTT